MFGLNLATEKVDLTLAFLISIKGISKLFFQAARLRRVKCYGCYYMEKRMEAEDGFVFSSAKVLFAWAGGHFAWDLLKDVSERTLKVYKSKEISTDWIARINAKFVGEVCVFTHCTAEPVVENVGPFPLSNGLRQLASKERKRLKSEGRPNDPHAIVTGDTLWKSDPVQIRIRTLDFADVCALRSVQERPRILSASAVLVCPERRILLLHERGSAIATYPGCIHTLGGAFIPDDRKGVAPDRAGTRSTVAREIHEEIQVTVSGSESPALILAEELSTGFIQAVFLGFSLAPQVMDRMVSNWEGKPLCVPYDELPRFLDQPSWVPSGKAHVMAWLAIGAPNGGRAPKFAGLSAKQLFDLLVKQ